jgi:hypothetical protein
MSAHQALNIADLGERGNRGLHGRFPQVVLQKRGDVGGKLNASARCRQIFRRTRQGGRRPKGERRPPQ